MAFKKTYHLNGCELHVRFLEKLISIEKPEELNKYLASDIQYRTQTLASFIKSDYFKFFDKELKITEKSIIVEIWGHVFVSHIAKRFKTIIPIYPAKRFADFIIKRCNKIDCGERSIDSNRFVWDLLSAFKPFILFFIPKRFKLSK